MRTWHFVYGPILGTLMFLWFGVAQAAYTNYIQDAGSIELKPRATQTRLTYKVKQSNSGVYSVHANPGAYRRAMRLLGR